MIMQCIDVGHIIIFNVVPGKASWQDGSTLSYTNLEPEAWTSGRQSNPNCVVMMAGDDGNWKTVSCDSTKSRVVCKTEASEYPSYWEVSVSSVEPETFCLYTFGVWNKTKTDGFTPALLVRVCRLSSSAGILHHSRPRPHVSHRLHCLQEEAILFLLDGPLREDTWWFGHHQYNNRR